MRSRRPGATVRSFEVGDRVTALSYKGGNKWLAGVVIEKTGPVSYKIQVEGGWIKRHVDQMKKDSRMHGETETKGRSMMEFVDPNPLTVNPQRVQEQIDTPAVEPH